MRISVVGSSGSGKTTLARRLADVLGVESVELDSIHWGPDWTPRDPDEIRARVVAATAGDSWVVDGNYQSILGTLVLERADVVAWLNPPRWRAMSRSVRRTALRAATGEELWSGNRESWRGLMFWRGESSVVWWAWTSYPGTTERYEQRMAQAGGTGARWHRLRTRRDVERFVAAVSAARG
ncbi:hypothetical protein GCM10022237_30180 [Nocardioides ginsengisoli]|uniref:Adenylate kinase n=1 Tax=Nocardioides ginsengisoli TaxID=363868 RepID=A0ABW3VUZ9_9ACTN